MGIFKKTIKYSKPSTEIDNKIKDLNEGLKKTKSTSLEQKFSAEEVEEILSEEVVDIENWREIFDENTVSTYQEKIDEVRERHNDLIKVQGSIEYVKNKEVKEIFEELYKGEVENVVDSYVKKYSNDIVDLREDLFREIKKKPTIDLKSLEEKINFLTLKYNQLSEGLLEEPTTGLEDAITLEQLKNHYQLLVSRLQEQLATLGGGGIEDAPKYDSNSGNLESSIFVRQAQKWKKFGEVGVVTFQGVHVDPTGVGLTYTEDLVIQGNTRVTGILSIGTASIVLDPEAGSIGGLSEINATSINAGSAIFGGNVSIGGTLTYEDVTSIDSIGIITARDGITVSAGGIDVVSGVVTATSFNGDGSSLSGVITSIVAGSNITVTTSGGISTISSSGGGGGSAGIVVQEEGSSVGTAGTINFVGTGVTATFANGIATVTISSDGGSGFSGDYNDLTNKPTIPSDTGDLTNNAGFVTFTNVSQLNNDSGFVTFTKVSQLTNDSNYITAASTFSGDYNDLTNTPTIPSDTGDLTNNVGFITSGASGAGLTALTGASQGTYGNSTNVPQITVDANGRITQIGLVGISGGGGGGGVAGINIFNGSTSLGVTTHLAFGDNVTATSIGNTISVDVTGVVTSLVGYATEGYVDNAVAISTFSGDYNDLTNTPTIPTNNNQLTNGAGFVTFTNVSQLNNDSNYITAASTFSGNYNDLSNKPTIPSDTGDLTNNAGFVTFTNVSQLTNDSGYITAASTFSGNYNDLSNKPTIPSDTGDLTNSVGFVTSGGTVALSQGLTGTPNITVGDIVANNVSIAQTLTYEDVTNIDSIGLITARSGIIATGVVTATSFVKSSNSGGFLKADGTEDTSTYLTSVDPTNTDIQGMWSVGGNTSGYTFTGPGQDGSEYNPDIYLVRGQRYRFVNSLGSNHPFEFRNAANNADYTDGITGSQSGTQDFNVQHDAPPVLKYRCTIHTVSMLGTIYIIGGTQVISGIVTATGFSTTNGTSSQFLKADGSVDGSTYLTSETQTLDDVLGLGNTSSTGLSVGVVTATSFSGSGAGLTNIPSSQLTGALPAIDGSALTGVTASGTGIVVQEEGSNIGTAGTINFVGTGVTATFANGIATVTISSSSGGSGNSGITTATGTFTASAGVAYTANTYGVNTYVNSEYTLFFQHSTGIQSQKVLVMDDGSTAYSQEYGIMYSNNAVISVGATVKSGNVELWWTPESGVSGIVTYSYRRSVL